MSIHQPQKKKRFTHGFDESNREASTIEFMPIFSSRPFACLRGLFSQQAKSTLPKNILFEKERLKRKSYPIQ
jgi:hypothetical protein